MRAGAIFVVLTLAGCGGGGEGAKDGGDAAAPDAAASDAMLQEADGALDGGAVDALVAQAPALPVLGPCAPGWREVQNAGVTWCDPWPATGPAACADGEAHLPGAPGCAKLGTACPVAGYATNLPAGASIVYVKATPEGSAGTGTLASPYRTIAQATAMASPGTIIALPVGRFAEDVLVPAGVTVWGACTVGTTIVGSATVAPVVRFAAGTGALRNLSVDTATSDYTIVVPQNVSAAIEDVFIRADYVGLDVSGGLLTMRRARVVAINVLDVRVVEESIGTVTLDQVVLEGVPTAHSAFTAATVTIRDSHLTQPFDVDNQPMFGARFTLTRSAVSTGRSAINGVGLGGPILATISDSAFRGVVGQTRAEAPTGAILYTGAAVELSMSRVSIVDHDGTALGLASSMARLDDLVVLSDATLTGSGRGLSVRSRAIVNGRRLLFANTRHLAIGAYEAGTALDLEDVTVAGVADPTCAATTCTSFAGSAIGVGAYQGGHATLRRFAIRGSILAGLQVDATGILDLHEGAVVDNVIGANLQQPGYDLSLLTDRVLYRNSVNFDSATLPLPPKPLM